MSWFGFKSSAVNTPANTTANTTANTAAKNIVINLKKQISNLDPRNLMQFNTKIDFLKKYINTNKNIISTPEFAEQVRERGSDHDIFLETAYFFVFRMIAFTTAKQKKRAEFFSIDTQNKYIELTKELYILILKTIGNDNTDIDDLYKQITNEYPPKFPPKENVSTNNTTAATAGGNKWKNKPANKPALSNGGSSPIEINEMLQTIEEKAKQLNLPLNKYLSETLGVPEKEAPILHDALECLESWRGSSSTALTGGRKRNMRKKRTHKKHRGGKRTCRR